MNDSDFISAAREVLKCEANSILAAVDRLDANFARAVGEILSHKGKLLACYRLVEGSPDQVTINMRRVVENALNANASLVVLSHNHPSGVALPSKEDNQTTLQIKRALADIGVQLVDHVIVADGDFVCLRDNGLLD